MNPPYGCLSSIFIAINTCFHTTINERAVGAGAYTGPWAEVVFGPYKGGSFIAINTCNHTATNETAERRVGACPHRRTRTW